MLMLHLSPADKALAGIHSTVLLNSHSHFDICSILVPSEFMFLLLLTTRARCVIEAVEHRKGIADTYPDLVLGAETVQHAWWKMRG